MVINVNREGLAAYTEEYQLVSSYDLASLSAQVTNMLRSGWTLYKNPFALNDNVVQSMVKRTWIEKKEDNRRKQNEVQV